MKTVVVFDLDGTLIDTAPDLAASLNHCLRAAGMAEVPLDRIRPYAGHGARVMLRQAYAFADRPLPDAELAAQVECFLAYYEAHIADGSQPFPGVVEAMERLTEAGFDLAVCTNKYARLSTKLLDALGLARSFKAVCGADTFAHRKPDPRHLTETIGMAGGTASNAVMIGDTWTDVETALAADVPVVLVDFGYAPVEMARRHADLVIESYGALGPGTVRTLLAQRDLAARKARS